MRNCVRTKPSDQISNSGFRHHGAAGRRDFRTSLDVEKDGAPRARDGLCRIMLDFDKPSVRGVVQTHALLFEPRWGILRIDTYMAIVVWQRGIINPCVRMGHCVKWKIGPLWQGDIIGEDFPNFENADWRALVTFALEGVSSLCRSGMHANPPCKAVAPIQDIPRRRGGRPFAIPFFEELETTPRGVPIRGDGNNDLLGLRRKRICLKANR